MLPLLSHTATPASGARRSYFLPGFLAFGRAMAQTETTPQTRLIALIAASGNRALGGSPSSSKKRRSGGGAGASVGVGIAPRAFGDDRGAAPALVTIGADDLCTAFDPDGLDKQWTANEVLRVTEAMPNMRLPFAAANPVPTVMALDRAVFEGGYTDSTSELVDADVSDGNRGFALHGDMANALDFGLSLVGAGVGHGGRIQGASDAYIGRLRCIRVRSPAQGRPGPPSPGGGFGGNHSPIRRG